MKAKYLVSILTVVVCLGSSAAWAGQSVLELVPSDAIGFAVVNRLGQTDAKIGKLAETANLPMPGTPLATIKAMGQIDEGLNEKGSAALVALPGDGPRPEPLIIIPVSDYQAFIANLNPEKVTDTISRIAFGRGGKALVAQKGDYALVVESFNQDLLETLLAGKPSIADKVEPWKTWIDGMDAVVVLPEGGVQMLLAVANQGLTVAKMQVAQSGEQGAQAVPVLDAYQKLLGTMGHEVTALGLGIVIEDDGSVRLASRGRFMPDGQVAEWIKGAKPMAGGPWAGIAKGPYCFAFAGALPEGMLHGLMKLSIDMPNTMGLDESQMKKIIDLSMDTAKDMQGMSMAFGVPAEGKPLYQAVTGTVRVADSGAFIDKYVGLIESFDSVIGDDDESMFKDMKATRVEIAGRPGLEVAVDLSGMYNSEEFAPAVPMFKAMYGEDPVMRIYLAAADKQTVVFAYIDKSRAADAVAAVTESNSLAAEPSVAAMMKRLPAGSQWVGLWSPGGTVELAQKMMSAFAPDNATELPPFPATEPVGFSAKATDTEVQKELIVPAGVIKHLPAYLDGLKDAAEKPSDIE